jgi:hypothetical protein
MRAVVCVIALALLTSCTSAPAPSPIPASDVVLTTKVSNGSVAVIVKRTYAVGETVRATVRLAPTSGSLRGPVDPIIQASGFHGTATVRHLTAAAVIAQPPAGQTVEISWDMRDDSGNAVGGDDYSLVFNVVDDAGTTTSVGATVQVR